MRTEKLKPSKWWYVLAAVIVIISFVIFWIVFLKLFVSLKNSIHQVIVPGTHRLNLKTSGDYIIYHEHQSVVGGKYFATERKVIPGLKCTVHSMDRAEEIMVSSIPPDSSYAFGNRQAVSILKFRIQRPGAYVLTALYENGYDAPQTVLGILKDLPRNPFVIAVSTALMSVPMILLPACIFWVTFFKRRKAKKQLGQTNV